VRQPTGREILAVILLVLVVALIVLIGARLLGPL
jgi:hypothetical protein